MTYSGHIKNGVAVLDGAAKLPEGTAVRIEVEGGPSESWRNRTLEELAREQGVKPMPSCRELAGDWPAEDSVDDFLAFIRGARR
ncbi:MAG: hypothetical protein WD768_07875 [Phycisphaeraceae bacterium]